MRAPPWGTVPVSRRNVWPAVFTAALLALAAAAVLSALGWTPRARLFPLAVAIPMGVLLLWQFGLDVVRVVRPGTVAQGEGTVDIPVDKSVPMDVVVRRALEALGWLLGLTAGLVLFGFLVAMPVFVCVYLAVRARERLAGVAIGTGFILVILVVVFNQILNVRWPRPYFPGLEQAIISLLSG